MRKKATYKNLKHQWFRCKMLLMLLLTELVLSNHWFRDARMSTAKLVLCCDSEDVFLPFNKFSDRTARALQGGSDGNPADLVILVVFLF